MKENIPKEILEIFWIFRIMVAIIGWCLWVIVACVTSLFITSWLNLSDVTSLALLGASIVAPILLPIIDALLTRDT